MVVFTIIGSIIGAGFASGQEIYLFFYRYGTNGIYGLALCSLLMTYIIYKVLRIVYEKNINTYEEFLNIIFKRNIKCYKYLNLSYITNKTINIFLLFTFFIMIAGFGAYFSQEFEIKSIVGSFIIAFLSYLVFLTDIKGLTKVNSVIVPVLIICILGIGIRCIPNIEIKKLHTDVDVSAFEWIIKAIIYTSYNVILLIPILVNLKGYIRNKKRAFVVAIIAGGIFLLLSICVFSILLSVNVLFENIEMPAIYAIKSSFPEFRLVYGFVILVSIFTTATSVGMGFLENVCRDKKSYTHVAGIMCISSLIFSRFGFSNLVKVLFPSFGILGLIQIWRIIINRKVQ